MKGTFLKNWLMAALLAGACCGAAACDDDKDGEIPDTGIESVQGKYSGTMSVVEVVPFSGEDTEEPGGATLDAVVTETVIELADIPIRDLIVRILGTEEGVDDLVEAIGPVDYVIPYVAQMSEDASSVELTLDPSVLKLLLPAGETGDSVEIEVTIEAETSGSYVPETEKLGFGLSVTGVELAGAGLEDFAPFSLDFDFDKQK